MPIIKSAKKRVRQEKKRRIRNKLITDEVKKTTKELNNSFQTKDKKKVENLFKIAQKAIIRASNKGIIKKKTASRKISHLNKKIRAI